MVRCIREISTAMRGLPVNISRRRAISLTTKKNTQECKRTRDLYLFCKLNQAVNRVKRAFKTFLFQKFFSETMVKQLWQFFRNFLVNFDSLRPRNHKIIAILVPLKRGRNAFRILPNRTAVRQNRSK